ncbi:MAG: hypothetical protein A2Z96_04970 [Spirochaetes bacterium GWB1_48_6]|nr:MAG: hypothetical protein A2Z96_04970 [Spirochaetes bacterium GWB1_48_6]
MKPLGFFLAALGSLSVLVVSIFISGSPFVIFLDFPSLLLLVGIQIMVTLAFSGFHGIARAFTAPFENTPAPAELRKARSYWKGQTTISLMAGFLGVLLGIISMMQNLSDNSALGRGAALALLILFYALILNLTIFIPYRLLCERRLAE